MQYKLIDRPVYHHLAEYQDSINKIVFFLSKFDNVISIYQLGSIKDPGISDIDILLIFKDNTTLKVDPRKIMDDKDKYFFTHAIFCIQESELKEFRKYYHLNNYKHLYGATSLTVQSLKIPKIIKEQIATEYLLKMFISLSGQRNCGIIKLRAFLLESKAIGFDLELLNIFDGPLFNVVKDISVLRQNWFRAQATNTEILLIINKFYKELTEFLNNQQLKIALPVAKKYKFGKNIFLHKSDVFEEKLNKFALPNFLKLNSIVPTRYSKKYLNLMNRLIRLNFLIVTKDITIYSDLMEKYNFEIKYRLNTKLNYPHFSTLLTPFNVEILK